jgi:Tfp pilus assembly protein PilF
MTQYGSCLLVTGDPEKARNLFDTILKQQDTRGNRLGYAYACWKAKDYIQGSQALNPLLDGASPDPESLTLAARIAEYAGTRPVR